MTRCHQFFLPDYNYALISASKDFHTLDVSKLSNKSFYLIIHLV